MTSAPPPTVYSATWCGPCTRLKAQLANARIPPVQDDAGAPASFQTGIGLYFLVTPNAQGGTVKIETMRVAPRPLRRYAASAPANLPGGGEATVRLRCEVGADGSCSNVAVLNVTAGSESFRRWGIASMEGWQFAPQRVNGKPVPGQFTQTLTLVSRDALPSEFRQHQQPR